VSESSAVTYTRDGMVAIITINRPERMNRLDAEIVDGLHDRWVQFMGDDAARVAVLSGNGKAFSAGADLKNVPHHLYHGMPGIGFPVDKPVVAAVQGWCIGGAMVLTTMADIMIVSEDAKFSYPEVKIAFSGGLISNLVTRIPHKIAMELLLVGDTIDAKRAYEVGYANKIVPLDQLMPTAMDYAMRIADTAPMPSRMLKRFASETLPKGPTEIAGIARSQVDAINRSSDWIEGRAAFTEKRPPKFKGK
jgi:enoyl-CoA hydratase